MSQLFRRRQPVAVLAAPPVPNTGVACAMASCSSDNAHPCDYCDSRGRECKAVYCPGHSVSIEGASYCRRHAGVIRAIGTPATQMGGLPDIDNRAPSLVNWVARDLDTNVRRLLTGVARTGESIIVDDTVHAARDFNRNARWEQSWRLVDHTGLILKVTIQVPEDNDSLVRVHVGRGVIADGVPPWIGHRAEDTEREMAIDISQRKRFYEWLDESIFMAVDSFRTSRERGR